MTTVLDKQDFLPGILRGKEFECNCKVLLASTLTGGKERFAVKTSLRIVSSEESPPDGIYSLTVYGRVFKVRRVGGQWPTLRL
jgi:hypothetical protein